MKRRWMALAVGLLVFGSLFVGNAAAHEENKHVEFTPACAPPTGSTIHGHQGEVSFTIHVCHPMGLGPVFDKVDQLVD